MVVEIDSKEIQYGGKPFHGTNIFLIFAFS